MKDFEFYQNLDLRYPEIAICVDAIDRYTGKFYIPVLTPILDKDQPYDITDINVNKSNILSDSSSMDITACTSSNYLTLAVPNPDDYQYYKDMIGDQFVVIFVGGDPNKPVLLGRYYNAINQ